jgi:NADH:quinone reductase (non-electrogenic)
VTSPWKVVIVGGGFGGLNAARALTSAPVDVTLVDRRNYHLFQPLLYQVATGSLSPGDIAAPLRSVLSRQRNTRVLLGQVEDVDPLAKRVILADGAALEYDSLVVAAGSQTSYYGHEAWSPWAPGLKSIEEATNIRHKILYAFEVAERIADPVQRRAWLTFIIVGAGPTGVELAGAIGEVAPQTLKNDFRSIDRMVRAFVHLLYIVEFEGRLVVFIKWAIQDLTFNRSARLITGDAPTDFDFNSEVSRNTSLPI